MRGQTLILSEVSTQLLVVQAQGRLALSLDLGKASSFGRDLRILPRAGKQRQVEADAEVHHVAVLTATSQVVDPQLQSGVFSAMAW